METGSEYYAECRCLHKQLFLPFIFRIALMPKQILMNKISIIKLQ